MRSPRKRSLLGELVVPASDARTAVPASLARSTAAMTALTAVSRTTGFVRVLVVAAVLGTTFLGNTYASANAVPNLVFELFAAGALQAVLVPTLVQLLHAGERDQAEHVARSVLGAVLAGLGVLVAAGALAAPWLMRLLVAAVEDPTVRAEQVRLGTVFLWLFLPQVLLYAVGAVATGLLHASSRFGLPALAPVANNVVVIAAYLLFHLLRGGAPPDLDLTAAQVAVLAGGTTAGVVALSAVPAVGVRRLGFSLRPRLDLRHPLVRRLARQGLWAGAFLAASQGLLGAVLVLANRVEGGVVAWQVGFTLFLLPHALFALPVLTALFPALSRAASAGEWRLFARAVERGTATIAWFVLPAAAALFVLADPLAEVLLFGAAGAGAAHVADAVRGFAPGLLGYGAYLLLVRAWYATGNTRTPAVVTAAVVAGGVALMVLVAATVDEPALVGGLAVAHSAAYTVGAVALLATLAGRLPAAARPRPGWAVAQGLLAASLAGVAMALVSGVWRAGGPTGRLVIAGAVGVLVYLGAQAVGGTTPAAVVASLDREPIRG